MKSNVKKFLAVLCLSTSVVGAVPFGTVRAVLGEEDREHFVREFDKVSMGDRYPCIKKMKEEGKLTAKEAFALMVFGCLRGKSEISKGKIKLTYSILSFWLMEENFGGFLVSVRDCIKRYLDANKIEAESGYVKTEEQTLKVLNEVIEGKKDVEEAFKELDPHVIDGKAVDVPQKLLDIIQTSHDFLKSGLDGWYSAEGYDNIIYGDWHRTVLDFARCGKISRHNAFKLMVGGILGFWKSNTVDYSVDQMEEMLRFTLVQGEDYTEFFKLFDNITGKRRPYSEGFECDTIRIVDSFRKRTMSFDEAYGAIGRVLNGRIG